MEHESPTKRPSEEWYKDEMRVEIQKGHENGKSLRKRRSKTGRGQVLSITKNPPRTIGRLPPVVLKDNGTKSEHSDVESRECY